MRRQISVALNQRKARQSILIVRIAKWDQYKNFEVRGEAFVKAIKQIVSREDK